MFTPILIPNKNSHDLGNNVNPTNRKLKLSSFLILFVLTKKKTCKSVRKTIHHEPVHVGQRNLILRVEIKPGTRQASSLIKIPPPRVRNVYPTWTLMVDCYSLNCQLDSTSETKHFKGQLHISYLGWLTYIWATLRENLSSVVCEQQMPRPACTYAQSDQHLCYSLILTYHIQA